MKKGTKYTLIGISGFFGIVIIGIICFLLLFFVAFGGLTFLFPVPRPTITYGEFPISVTYEYDGEIKTVEDTVICEFDGFEVLGEAGKRRKWKQYLKSGNERLVICKVEQSEEFSFEVQLFYGFADYYMGEMDDSDRKYYEESLAYNNIYYIQSKSGVQTRQTISSKDTWNKCRLKIIDIQYSKPIENTFRYFGIFSASIYG